MDDKRHVVFLVHGIRTQGEWRQRAEGILGSDPRIRVCPIRYQFFDLFRFLLPIGGFRDRPVRRVTALIRDELSKGPTHLSVVAHSFGTYIISKILECEPDIKFHRVILCGSIIPDNFDWERYGHRFDSDSSGNCYVVNDCGMRDILPVLAQSVTWGYGSSGRFGFGHPRIKDRFFDVDHSGFFDESFIRTNWQPYISGGRIVEGVLNRPTTSWWISIITVFRLRWILVGALVTCAAIAAAPVALAFFADIGSASGTIGLAH